MIDDVNEVAQDMDPEAMDRQVFFALGAEIRAAAMSTVDLEGKETDVDPGVSMMFIATEQRDIDGEKVNLPPTRIFMFVPYEGVPAMVQLMMIAMSELADVGQGVADGDLGMRLIMPPGVPTDIVDRAQAQGAQGGKLTAEMLNEMIRKSKEGGQ